MFASDISTKTHHVGHVLAVGALLCAALGGSARAGIAEVGAMRLDYADTWQRAGAAEEDEDDSIILRHAAQPEGMTVFLPRRAVPLKISEAQFYDQLERKWRAQYGKAASISSIVADGRSWRLCVRPSLERPATVFHLVTVQAGRAHHLLAVGQGDASGLPGELLALLSGIAWPAGEPVRVAAAPMTPVAQETPAAPAPPGRVETSARVETPQPVAAPAPTPAAAPAGVAVESAPVPPGALAGPGWQLLRASRQAATGKALARLADLEARRIGDAGMLLGYGLSAREQGLDWFIDGYQFDPFIPGKAGRKAFALNWNLAWQAPATWDGGASLPLPVVFTGSVTPPDAAAQAGVRADIRLLCGTRMAVVRAMDAIERNEAGAAGQLTALAQACPENSAAGSTADLLVPAANGEAGAEFRLERVLSVPNGLTAVTAPPEGQVRRILLTLRGIASAQGGAVGDSLLGGATVYYVYGPTSLK